ncbi:MAG: hypothetical protein ABIQ86_12440 [Steroidobacteraceae bacterium]
MRIKLRITLVTFIALLSMASTLKADILVERIQGQPKFSDGKALGYFIWKDGDTWKLRWMTFGAEHRFTGRIVVEGGEIKSMKRVDVDTERKVVAPGRPGRVVRGPRGKVVGRTRGRTAVVVSKEEDKIEQETEQVIRFATATDDDVDGVNFELKGNPRLVRFVLEMDGKPRPEEVEVGRTNFKPNEHPLVVRMP